MRMSDLVKKAQDWMNNPVEYVNKPINPGVQPVPGLTLTPAVIDTLKKFDAIGFDISTLDNVRDLATHLIDRSVAGAIFDWRDNEYSAVLDTVRGKIPSNGAPSGGTPPDAAEEPVEQQHVAMLQTVLALRVKTALFKLGQYSPDDMSLLVNVISDAGLDITSPRDAMSVLEILAKSPSPSAGLAAEMVNFVRKDPSKWDELLEGSIKFEKHPEPDYPVVLEKDKNIYTPMVDDSEALAPGSTMDINFDPGDDPGGGTEEEEKEVKPGPGKRVMAPTKNMGSYVDNYDKFISQAPPYVRRLQWGAPSGVMILEEKPKSHKQVPSNGGMFVKDYDTMQDGMIIGTTPDKSLAVAVVQTGTIEVWDPMFKELRKSLHQYKPTY